MPEDDTPTLRQYVEAILDEQRRSFVLAEEKREKAVTALLEELHRRITDGDKNLADHLTQQIEEVKTALAYAQRETTIRFEASQESVRKADIATEKRFESVNEFRQQLGDQVATFMPREVADAALAELRTKGEKNASLIAELGAANRGAQVRQTTIISIATFFIIVAMALLSFTARVRAAEVSTTPYKMGTKPVPCLSLMARCSDGYTI